VLAATAGEYNFDCSLDREFFDFAGIDSNAFKSFGGPTALLRNDTGT
jgi:hypothetical protein